jgi:predicted O-methyltransferase YrrM
MSVVQRRGEPTPTYSSQPADDFLMPDVLADATADYLASVAPPADDLVLEMEAHADREAIPVADRSVATLQAILARATGADRALEFGTAIGYSTLHVARTGTDVVTTEVDAERIAAAVDYLERDGVPVRVTDDPATVDPDAAGGGRVVIVEGPALETLPALDGPFDLAFLDAVKTEYEAYLSGALSLLADGGLVVADNLLWQGNVPAADEDVDPDREASTAALRAFNEVFVAHDRLDAVITPLGDGTGIAVKTR